MFALTPNRPVDYMFTQLPVDLDNINVLIIYDLNTISI